MLKLYERWRLPGRSVIYAFITSLVVFFVAVPIASASSHSPTITLVGPKARYLALGDSLAFGFQPDLNLTNGYSNALTNDLRSHHNQHASNLGCPGETSSTFIHSGCPNAFLRKYPYLGAQLDAAVAYLHRYQGQVSPVTLDIGSNDVLTDINPKTCSIDTSKFKSDLARLDDNLTKTILPHLRDALMVNGKMSGDLALMNYYDPYQNLCPKTVPMVQELNQHLARDISGYGVIADAFSAFGGARTPNSNICSYTWICSIFHDVHAKTTGYREIAKAFEKALGY